MSELNYFFLQLQLQYHIELEDRKSVIIFDEVQLCPKARQAIKTLVKDGRYDYIETGSLISIKKNVKDILIPSEERKIQMHPMDYEEFLWALNDSVTIKVLNSYKTTNTTILNLISGLKDSKVVSVAYHANNPDIGLSACKDLNQFKLYMADTGLFVTLQFKDKDFTENIIYEKLLSDKLATNLGYLYENAVAQILTATGNDLFYYTFYQEEQKRNYEIDFLISKRNKICPIEVKSSRYKVHASIDTFYEKFSVRILNRYIIHTKDVSKDKDILCLPIYLTQFIVQKDND